MLNRKTLFPGIIELNFQAGEVLGCNVYLVFDADEWVLIDIGYEETVDDFVEIIHLYACIPVFLRIENDVRPLLTRAKAHIGLHFYIGQPLGGHAPFKFGHQLLRPPRFAIDILADETNRFHCFLSSVPLLIKTRTDDSSPLLAPNCPKAQGRFRERSALFARFRVVQD
jgi:hypothetical protein